MILYYIILYYFIYTYVIYTYIIYTYIIYYIYTYYIYYIYIYYIYYIHIDHGNYQQYLLLYIQLTRKVEKTVARDLERFPPGKSTMTGESMTGEMTGEYGTIFLSHGSIIHMEI